MEFPITKQRLQNFKQNEAAQVQTKLIVTKVVKNICDSIQRTLIHTTDTFYSQDITDWNLAGVLPVLNEVLIKLQELFPDSLINVDEPKTRILIDWS